MDVHAMTKAKIVNDIWNKFEPALGRFGQAFDQNSPVLLAFACSLASGAVKRWRRRPWTRPPWQSGRRVSVGCHRTKEGQS